MINIIVDEAYAFDMLSILEVKHKKQKSESSLKNFQDFGEAIENQLGVLFEDILASEEYDLLLFTNTILFDLIDDIKNGDDITAKDVDDLNYLRWEYKNKLQERFFGKKTSEEKLGYEKTN